jgi:hypothetical protein
MARQRQMARPVSDTGAYLIAKVTGLLDSQRAWEAWREARAA